MTVWVTVLVFVTVDGAAVVGVSVFCVTVTVLGTGVPVSVLGAGVPESVVGATVSVCGPCVMTVVPLCTRCGGPAAVLGAAELAAAVVPAVLLGVVVDAVVGDELVANFNAA